MQEIDRSAQDPGSDEPRDRRDHEPPPNLSVKVCHMGVGLLRAVRRKGINAVFPSVPNAPEHIATVDQPWYQEDDDPVDQDVGVWIDRFHQDLTTIIWPEVDP